MTSGRLADLLRDAIERLGAAGIATPRTDASLLLAHVLDVPRWRVATNPDRIAAAADVERFETLLAQRVRRRPISHILGRVEFWSLDFKVTDDTLAPRPETELLVEEALRHLRSTADPVAADVGTGTGCIPISLLEDHRSLRMHAVDICERALAVARENAEGHGNSARLTFHHGDLLEPLAAVLAPGSLDVVISNPPYVRHDERDTVDAEVLWEPEGAVFCPGEPRVVYGAIARQAAPLTRSGGLLLLELPGDDPSAVIAEVQVDGAWGDVTIRNDLAGLPRVLRALRA